MSFNSRLFLDFSEANGATEAQGIVGRTPPQSAARTKSRQAKAPTQAGEFVRTYYIPLWFHLYGIGWLRFIPALQLALRIEQPMKKDWELFTLLSLLHATCCVSMYFECLLWPADCVQDNRQFSIANLLFCLQAH